MMSNLFRIILVCTFVTLVSSAEQVSNCFECAKKGRDRFICSSKNALNFEVTCCSKGEKDSFCQPNENRVCSKPLENGPEFYAFCPLINSTSCGLSTSDKDDFSLWAKPAARDFSFDRLYYKRGSQHKFT